MVATQNIDTLGPIWTFSLRGVITFVASGLDINGFATEVRALRPATVVRALRPATEVRADPLLAEELNTFYGRFECNGGATLPNSASGSSRQSSDHVITVLEDEVRRELRRVNVRKAAGPDGITGRVLRSCADQLAGLFTSIFNESLATSVVPTSFKNLL